MEKLLNKIFMPLLAGFLAFAFAAAALTVSAAEPQSVAAASAGWVGGDAVYLDVSNVPYWYSPWNDSVFTFYNGSGYAISGKVHAVEGIKTVVNGSEVPYFFEVEIPSGTWDSLTFSRADLITDETTSVNRWGESARLSDASKNAIKISSNWYEATESVYSDADRAIWWGTQFLASISVCDPTGVNDNVTSALWSARKTQFSYMAASVKALIKGLAPNVGGSDAQKALARYDYIVKKYGLDDFIGASSSATQTIASPASSSPAGVIALASLTILGAATIAGFFLATNRHRA